MSTEAPSLEDQKRTEAATAWWIRLQDDEATGFSAEFREWLAIPENERTFQEIELAAETLDEFGTSPSIAEMHRSAHIWLENQAAPRHRPFRKAAYVLAAASLLVSIGAGTYYLWSANRALSYQTAMDERRTVTLEDGSRIVLDSNSEVDVRYSKNARTIIMPRGRARFDVAHDTARPFSVTAGTEMVIAVGTAFDVERRGDKVLVTLIQGRVLIKEALAEPSRHNEADKTVRLSAGQQLVVSADHQSLIAPVDLDVTQAWEAGHLVFRSERLADAAEQINRYTNHPVIIDPSAASFRLSGVFNTGDTKSFISAVTEVFPVQAVPDADGMITLRRSP